MHYRQHPGFTVVELIVVIVSIAILATISSIAYIGAQKQATVATVQSDLDAAMTEVQREYRDTGEYPDTYNFSTSNNNQLTVISSGAGVYYDTLTEVQKGVLLTDICDELLDEGAGQGLNNGGNTMNYVISCDVWNANRMQIEAWQTQQWSVPVQESALVDYANNYTGHDQQYTPAATEVVRNFYLSMVERYKARGGTFPITSFWDSWANGSNGGVPEEPLPDGTTTQTICVEGTNPSHTDIVWHFTEEMRLRSGPC